VWKEQCHKRQKGRPGEDSFILASCIRLKTGARSSWLMSVILVTWEAEIGKIKV
jgi:hypothetical protein